MTPGENDPASFFCKIYYFVLQSTKINLYLCIEKYFVK